MYKNVDNTDFGVLEKNPGHDGDTSPWAVTVTVKSWFFVTVTTTVTGGEKNIHRHRHRREKKIHRHRHRRTKKYSPSPSPPVDIFFTVTVKYIFYHHDYSEKYFIEFTNLNTILWVNGPNIGSTSFNI